MSQTLQDTLGSSIALTDYDEDEDGFREYLRDLADEMFPFDGYRENQDEMVYEVLEAFFIDGYRNVIVEGPTGIGKSPANVAICRVISELNRRQFDITNHFGVHIRGLTSGRSFYTTPQKSLRNQLAEDEDLQEYVTMLKSRRDYTCGLTGQNCQECRVRASNDHSCMDFQDCTYWPQKMDARESDIAAITFAMLIVDNYVPEESPEGEPLSFRDRDLVVIDEGHNSEGQSASMFAGTMLSPWKMPPDVYGDAGEQVSWEDDRLDDVREVVEGIRQRADTFATVYDEDEERQAEVEQCEEVVRKIDYCFRTADMGRGWVVDIQSVSERDGDGTTRGIKLEPVRVDDFLSDFVWSRGNRRLITSATIMFRDDIESWAERIGLDGDVKFISKKTPFPEEHRLIHLNTMVGPMSGDDEDENWNEAMDTIREIQSHHEGEKGLIHSVSYPRAERVGESLSSDMVVVHDSDTPQEQAFQEWQSDDGGDILVSPTMTEGEDLHGDLCRWQVLLKVPFANIGASRVDYLLNEESEWQWYYENAGIDIIQAVGRAVRGPEPEEAASFYVIDEKFEDVMYRTHPPEYFVQAVRDDPPEHWENPDAAPWR